VVSLGSRCTVGLLAETGLVSGISARRGGFPTAIDGGVDETFSVLAELPRAADPGARVHAALVTRPLPGNV